VKETADDLVAEAPATEEAPVEEEPAVAAAEPEPEPESKPEPTPEPAKDPVVESSNPDSGPKKQGWWQKRSFF
jgi:hypothetical protein